MINDKYNSFNIFLFFSERAIVYRFILRENRFRIGKHSGVSGKRDSAVHPSPLPEYMYRIKQ